MSKLYTGVRVVTGVATETISSLYADKSIERDFDKRFKFYENEILVLKTGSQSALARVSGPVVSLIPDKKELSVFGITPRNKEQIMAMDLLLNEKIDCVTMTGRAGTGKTLLALAYGLHAMERGLFDKLILTKPMSQVGKRPLGILPGEIEDKFGPYLDNFMDNVECLLPERYRDMDHLIDQYRIEFKPLQTMRGSSRNKALVIADEVQVLDYHEMVTLGTRMGEGSKLVLMGDLNQRDESIPKDKTGLYRWINSERIKNDAATASIELLKCERSYLAALFAEEFEAI